MLTLVHAGCAGEQEPAAKKKTAARPAKAVAVKPPGGKSPAGVWDEAVAEAQAGRIGQVLELYAPAEREWFLMVVYLGARQHAGEERAEELAAILRRHGCAGESPGITVQQMFAGANRPALAAALARFCGEAIQLPAQFGGALSELQVEGDYASARAGGRRFVAFKRIGGRWFLSWQTHHRVRTTRGPTIMLK